MNDLPDIEMSLIQTAFRSLKAESERYLINVELRETKEGSVAFHVRLRMREPSKSGSYPQMTLSLERHDPGKGHEDIHFQINESQ